MKKFIDEHNIQKKIYGYDTFEGMTPPLNDDFEINSNKSAISLLENDKLKKTNVWGYCSLENVKKNILGVFGNADNINLIKGPVEETLLVHNNVPEKISLLRLDTDFYSSTKIELEKLYHRVSKNGVIIIDDYGHWNGSRKAVDEFFKEKHVWKHYVDYACRLIVKN